MTIFAKALRPTLIASVALGGSTLAIGQTASPEAPPAADSSAWKVNQRACDEAAAK